MGSLSKCCNAEYDIDFEIKGSPSVCAKCGEILVEGAVEGDTPSITDIGSFKKPADKEPDIYDKFEKLDPNAPSDPDEEEPELRIHRRR